ncbi:MAG: lipocalin family protein [Candidatus Limnocylindrus sp.]
MMRRFILLLMSAVLAAACSGPLLANSPAPTGAPFEKATPRPNVVDPIAVELPRDDAPHDRLTEWWYVTGHLATLDGTREFGYEAVIFRAQRGEFPVTWASHMALTEKPRNGREGSFTYYERAEIGPQVDVSAESDLPIAAAFVITGADPLSPATFENELWSMVVGLDGSIHIGAEWFNLQLSAREAPVLHDNDGWVDFDVAGGSYYYSRTRMPTSGTLTVDGEVLAVQGTSWFDHQWGDFIAIGGGGWDWFALNLSDGSDLMLSFVRAKDGSFPLVYGTWVGANGVVQHIDGDQISLTALGSWTSPQTGAVWPSGWRVLIAQLGLDVTVTPELADQELNTIETTGVIYWEGANSVVGTLGGRPITGRSYVELTGYATLR